MKKQQIIRKQDKISCTCTKCRKTTDQYLVLEMHRYKGAVYMECPRCKSQIIYGIIFRRKNIKIKHSQNKHH